jgi:hypothetical protein
VGVTDRIAPNLRDLENRERGVCHPGLDKRGPPQVTDSTSAAPAQAATASGWGEALNPTP